MLPAISKFLATVWQRKQKRRGAPRRNLLILVVEQRGIEPLTSALRTRRSAKLSYCPTSKSRKIFLFENEKLASSDENTVSGFEFQVSSLANAPHQRTAFVACESVRLHSAREKSLRRRAHCFRGEQCSRATSRHHYLRPCEPAKME